MQPLVSILLNNYNYAPYVGDAIESALQQEYQNTEVIVVDDGSTDQSRSIIESFGNKIIPVFQQNGGQAAAFNSGFAASKGDVLCFLDSDDTFLPKKVALALEGLSHCPDGWCFHHLQWADSNLQALETPGIPFKTGRYDFRSEIVNGTCKFSPPATSGLTFARSLLQRLMPMPAQIKITSDNYLKYSALAVEPGYFIAEPLALQRIHGNNAYTGKKDPALRAEVHINTATGLKRNFPALRDVCDRMFAAGIADKWNSGASLRTISQDLSRYSSDSSIGQKVEIVSRAVYRGLRTRLRNES